MYQSNYGLKEPPFHVSQLHQSKQLPCRLLSVCQWASWLAWDLVSLSIESSASWEPPRPQANQDELPSVPRSVLNASYLGTRLILQLCEVDAIIPVLQVRKCLHSEAKKSVQGPPAAK